MIHDHFRVTGAHDTVLDFAGLFSVTPHDDNVQEFVSRWDGMLLSMTKIPPDDLLESLYKLRIRESDQLKTVLKLYDMEIHQKISKPDCQKLKTMVKRSTDQKLRLRSFDARNEKIETEAVVTSRRELSGIERGQGVCYQLKAKRAVFERFRRAQKPDHTAATPSEPHQNTRWNCVEKKCLRQKPVWEVQSTAV